LLWPETFFERMQNVLMDFGFRGALSDGFKKPIQGSHFLPVQAQGRRYARKALREPAEFVLSGRGQLGLKIAPADCLGGLDEEADRLGNESGDEAGQKEKRSRQKQSHAHTEHHNAVEQAL